MDAQKRWTLMAVVLGSGIVFLDSTVVNVALPAIGRDLPSKLFGELEGQSFVYSAYLLSLSALLILAGALSDFHGRRKMFFIGMAGFGASSLACGLAPSMETLIAFRVIQGAFGAMLVPGSLSIITSTFKGEEQGRAFGIWAGASAGTTILGPFLGGMLVDSVSWRAAFLINVPLVVLGLWATSRYVPESRDESATGKFDWSGAVVIALAVGGLTLGPIRGKEREWHDSIAYIVLAVGAAAAIAFPFLMARSPNPLVPLRLFKSRNFTVTNISTLLIYGALYVTFYYVPLFTQGTIGYSASAAGLAGIPGGLFLALFSSRFGKLASRYGPRRFMAMGPAIMAAGILWLARVPAGTHAWALKVSHPASLVPPSGYLVDFLPGLVVFGIGLMMMVAPLTTALMRSIPEGNAGVGSAINNAISRVGPQLAGAAIFVAITASFYHGLGARVPGLDVASAQVRARIAPLNQPKPGATSAEIGAARTSSAESFHLAMIISAGLLLAGAAVNAAGILNQKPEEAPASAE